MAWTTTDFREMIDVLTKSRILRERDGQFSFRYPYIYFYLKGQYLNEHLSNLSVRDYIANCCNHLYVRDHANTVLFLAHHTNDEFVLASITEALRKLFSQRAPLRLQGDTKEIAELISDAPKLFYSGEAPEKHRERRNEERDAIPVGDGLADAEETSGTLSLPAQIVSVFKTIEILGQVLKNQYSKIKRPQKMELLRELFSGPLRGLSDMFFHFAQDPSALVSAVASSLKHRTSEGISSKDVDAARKVVAHFVQLATLMFVARTAESVSSENLHEDIRSAVKEENTLAVRLIELAVLLDSPKRLPRKRLIELESDARGEILGERLLQLIILNRLYMYKTDESDLQWLAAEMGFDLRRLHTLTHQKRADRKLG